MASKSFTCTPYSKGLLCRAQASRNAALVEDFVQEVRDVAAQVSREVLKGQ
jgi:hypothetical protein